MEIFDLCPRSRSIQHFQISFNDFKYIILFDFHHLERARGKFETYINFALKPKLAYCLKKKKKHGLYYKDIYINNIVNMI